METFREHKTQKALSRISDRHSNNVGRNFGFDHNYVSIGVGGKGTNESCTIMWTYTVFYFLEWFWNFCSANIFHCISFSFYYFKIKAIKSPRCWNLRLSDRDLGYRAGNFQTRKHFICSIRLSKKSFVGFHMARTKCDRKPCKRDKSTSRDFVARGRPLRGQKRLAPLAKGSTCSKSTVPCMIEEDC